MFVCNYEHYHFLRDIYRDILHYKAYLRLEKWNQAKEPVFYLHPRLSRTSIAEVELLVSIVSISSQISSIHSMFGRRVCRIDIDHTFTATLTFGSATHSATYCAIASCWSAVGRLCFKISAIIFVNERIELGLVHLVKSLMNRSQYGSNSSRWWK